MEPFKTIRPEELTTNLFKAIDKNWMLITAEHKGKVNTMTASWGGTGILWGRPVAFVLIRPQRYTRELVDEAENLSLSFLPERYRKELSFCGSKSGRDVDKITTCGFTVAHSEGTPYFAEADTVFICRKLYRQPLDSNCFIDTSLDGEFYPTRDYHILYVAEIHEVFTR